MAAHGSEGRKASQVAGDRKIPMVSGIRNPGGTHQIRPGLVTGKGVLNQVLMTPCSRRSLLV